MQARTIFIQVEDTPNPDSMKFLPENTIVLAEEFGTGQVCGCGLAVRVCIGVCAKRAQ